MNSAQGSPGENTLGRKFKGMPVVVQPATQPDKSAAKTATAVMYCEANSGAIDGKTANGLVRHSEKYEFLSAIDSEKAGCDSGAVLGNEPNAIPVCRDLADALAHAGGIPDDVIFGMARSSGRLSTTERGIVLEAISLGMNVVNGLHEFLSDDPQFAAASAAMNVKILDVRKPRALKRLRTFSGRIAKVTCPKRCGTALHRKPR